MSPVADHHVHVLSPELIRDWTSLGAHFSRPHSAYTTASAALEPRGDRAAFLVSMAHIYGSPEFRAGLGLSSDTEHERARLANDHVARLVARAPDRRVGFCAVAPLRPYAAAEMERCRTELGLAGLKLHLPNSGLDLRDPRHLDILADIADRAERDGRPLLVHLMAADGAPDSAAIQAFIDRVVRPRPRLELHLAHLGGGGGYGVHSRRTVQAFAAFFDEAAEHAQRPISFELSGALLARRTDGVPASRRTDIRQLADDLRRLGLQRVLFGSDYPVFEPDDYARLLQDRLGLSATELSQVMANRAPALLRAAQRQDGEARHP